MASFGRLGIAALAANQELSLALANINFDFSLMKVEAPAEYHGVRNSLSTHRRHVAETGSPHVTARKLSALFEAEIPPIPRLIEAYGKRASEIAKELSGDNAFGEEAGAFVDFTGLDATTIWAAATSSKAAIAIHLLACMLARLWTPSQATSIWVELVDVRKKHIEASLEQEQSVGLFLAGQCQVTREQLAEWDNSARAWLRRADHVKRLQQTQLMLVCNNLDMPVSAKLDIYANVITGWTTSMRGMEDLLSGLPQRVQDGSLLLALSSWHIYPDMTVIGIQHIRQNDCLVPNVADIILNLESSPAHGSRGVYWCLSLARLRFYGDPAVHETSLNLESSRFTVEQLSYVALGSVIGSWGLYGRNLISACKLVTQLCEYAYDVDARPESLKKPRWFRMLADSARGLVDAKQSDKEVFLRLAKLGRSSGNSFLAPQDSYPLWLFGLSETSEFISFLSDPVHRVMLLLRIARKSMTDEQSISNSIIQYRINDNKSLEGPESYGYITAFPKTGVFHNWTAEQSTAFKLVQHPWYPAGTKYSVSWHSLPEALQNKKYVLKESWTFDNGKNPFFKILNSLHDLPKPENTNTEVSTSSPVQVQDVLAEDQTASSGETEQQNATHGPTFYLRFLGSVRSAALFTTGAPGDEWSSTVVDFETVSQAFSSDWVNKEALRESIKVMTHSLGFRNYASSLLALGFIEQIYKGLGDATITPSIIKSPLHAAKWLGIGEAHTYKELVKHPEMELSREETFSCICYLETGLNLGPKVFEKVIAISSEDSIYVAGGLLCDPIELRRKSLVKRLIGNFGKPGLALLVAPPNPLCRQPSPEDWKLINHDIYDNGAVENTFNSTTLHLSFTGWSMQIDSAANTSESGLVDKEAEIYEALVSVHERGKWVADLDILTATSKSCFDPEHEFYYKVGCDHDRSFVKPIEKLSNNTPDIQIDVTEPLLTIKSWEEFMDFLQHPNGPVLVMSYRNWTVRLAIASLAVMRKMRVFVNNGFCYDCYEELRASRKAEFSIRSIFIC